MHWPISRSAVFIAWSSEYQLIVPLTCMYAYVCYSADWGEANILS